MTYAVSQHWRPQKEVSTAEQFGDREYLQGKRWGGGDRWLDFQLVLAAFVTCLQSDARMIQVWKYTSSRDMHAGGHETRMHQTRTHLHIQHVTITIKRNTIERQYDLGSM